MAHHQSAIKRIRRDAKRVVRNHARIARIRTFIKKVELALLAGDKATASAAFSVAQPEIMKGVAKGILHINTASRKVSRLNSRISKLA